MEKEKKELEEAKDQLVTEVENFAKAEYELARLWAVEKMSNVVGSLLLTISLILVAFAVLAFCAAAAVIALSQCVPAWAACLIVGAFYFILIPLLCACRKVLFVKPIVRAMSGLKNGEELKFETLRAEGRAAVQRERMSGRIRFAKAMYSYYTSLASSAWGFIKGLFSKKK